MMRFLASDWSTPILSGISILIGFILERYLGIQLITGVLIGGTIVCVTVAWFVRV